MKPWTRKATLAGPRLRAGFEEHELQILHSLLTGLIEVLEGRRDSAPTDELSELTGIRSGHSEAPADGVLVRLLPDFQRPPGAAGGDAAGSGAAVPVDAVQADAVHADAVHADAVHADNAGMRMLHEPEILDAKLACAHAMLTSLPSRPGTVSLTEPVAEEWLRTLNDLRLSLGQLLLTATGGGPEGGIPDEVAPGDPRAQHLEVYQWLTFVQDSLCDALTSGW